MTIWDWLKQLGPGWPTERGWYAGAMFIQTNVILMMLWESQELRADDFFRQVANAIIITGWIGFIVSMQDRGAKDRDRADESLSLTRAAVRALGERRSAELPATDPLPPEPSPEKPDA